MKISEIKCNEVILPRGSTLGFKILPIDFTEEYLLGGQTSMDWSGIYVQFTIQHAVSYLVNHFDRGHTNAVLVQVTTKRDFPVIVYRDERFGIASLSSTDKAHYLRESLNSFDMTFKEYAETPLIQSVGEKFGAGIIMYDAIDNMECVIPHSLVTLEHFSFRPLASFSRHPTLLWKVQKVIIIKEDEKEEELKVNKDELEDTGLLGDRLQTFFPSTRHECWFHKYSTGDPSS